MPRQWHVSGVFWFLPLLIIFFAASGAAALIYEIVWFQMLQLITGSSAVSMAVLLGTFMGGLCLGSLALPRLIAPSWRPLYVYALLELGIAAYALLLLLAVPYLSGALISAIVLLPPTVLMGATLPAVARSVRDVSSLGVLYSSNIAGAVSGTLFAGFYLLRVYDMVVATYVAAVINISIAVIALVIGKNSGTETEFRTTGIRSPSPNSLYLVIALSGLCALGGEVVWTRLLSLMLGASVYTFSIIVAVFLVGLGVGSSGGAAISRRSSNPRRDLGICQLLAAVSIAWAAYLLTHVMPYWPLDSTQLNFQTGLLRSALAVFPAACFWGASFPLALSAAAGSHEDTGRVVGGIYAANTVGAILGSVGFSVFLMPAFGTQHAQQLMIVLSALAAVLILPGTIRFVALAAALLTFTVAPIPQTLIAYGRNLAQTVSEVEASTILYAGEGINASVAVSDAANGFRNFHVSGKIEASTEPEDMRLQRLLGHLPGLLHSRPRSVLVVGFGAGVTAGSFVMHPTVERIVICEIEPLIPQVVGKYFATQNYNVLEDPRVKVVYDDARHYLLTTDEKFDVITSDPIHPWVKGAAALYTREYFELVRRHLNPGGVVSQWVPLYQSSPEVVKTELATFFGVFPGGTVWTNNRGGTGFDIVLLGTDSHASFEQGELETRLARRDHINVVKSLAEIGFPSATDLRATYLADSNDLSPWLADAQINRDRNLRLQYLAGMGMTFNEAVSLYQTMAAYRPPRTLTSSQSASITNTLSSKTAKQISIAAAQGNSEALRYATALRLAIVAGGWTVGDVQQTEVGRRITGTLISVGNKPAPATANELFQALSLAGLPVTGAFDPGASPDSVLLIVGHQ